MKLYVFLLAVWQFACSGPGSGQSALPSPNYPPYPNVWGWVIPDTRQYEGYLGNGVQENGDVVIRYRYAITGAEARAAKLEYAEYGVTFFARESLPTVHSGPERVLVSQGKPTMGLKNGLTIQRIGSWGARRGCYGGLDATILKRDRVGNIMESKKFLYILDPPQRYETREDCNDGPPFLNRVDSIFADFLPLKDGTFLMIDHQHGVIMRFDAEFHSHSSLVNRRLFVVDEATFNDWLGQMNYGSRADTNLNLQIQQDALYQLLMEAKGRTKP